MARVESPRCSGPAAGGRAGEFLPDDPVLQCLRRGLEDVLNVVLAGGEQRGADGGVLGARGHRLHRRPADLPIRVLAGGEQRGADGGALG